MTLTKHNKSQLNGTVHVCAITSTRTDKRTHTTTLLRTLILFSVLLLLQPAAVQCQDESRFLRGDTNTNVTVKHVEEDEEQFILNLAHTMKPRPLHHHHNHEDHDPDEPVSGLSFRKHQFFHLHHMKSGGTSLSSWINCGTGRQQKITGTSVPSAGLSECSYKSYHKCVADDTNSCRKRIDSAVTMNFCSPLAVTNYFNWTDADAVTMMRHPVNRVWSMFRFQTKSCFKCTNLTQVYEDMDKGETEKYGTGGCLAQLSNHITRNMQQKINVKELDTIALSDEERVADAIDSIQNRFTVVGVIEQLEETIEQFSYTFPWLQEEISGSDRKCSFPHSNGSPKNNRCAAGKHWDLPDEPDEETRKAIEEHNRLDIMVYEAALERFEFQKLAMRLDLDVE